MSDDWISEDEFNAAVDEACQHWAEIGVEMALDYMQGAVGNAGQDTLVGELLPDVEGQVDSLADGEYDPIESNHPEAIGEICDQVNDWLGVIADICAEMRGLDYADAMDLWFF